MSRESHCHCLEIWTRAAPRSPDYLYLVIHSPWEWSLAFPVRSPPSPRPAQLALNCPATHSYPVSLPSEYPLIRIIFLLTSYHRFPSAVLVDLQISPHLATRPLSPQSIPSGRTEPLLQFGSLPSHVGNGHPSRSQIASQSSSLSSLLPPTSPFQLHQFPMTATAPAPTPPSPNNARFLPSLSRLCGPAFLVYISSITRTVHLLGPGLSPSLLVRSLPDRIPGGGNQPG